MIAVVPDSFYAFLFPIIYFTVPVFGLPMFSGSPHEIASDRGDFIDNGLIGYATCECKPRPTDTEIPDTNTIWYMEVYDRLSFSTSRSGGKIRFHIGGNRFAALFSCFGSSVAGVGWQSGGGFPDLRIFKNAVSALR